MKTEEQITKEMSNIDNVSLGQEGMKEYYRLQGQYAALAWVLKDEEEEKE